MRLHNTKRLAFVILLTFVVPNPLSGDAIEEVVKFVDRSGITPMTNECRNLLTERIASVAAERPAEFRAISEDNTVRVCIGGTYGAR